MKSAEGRKLLGVLVTITEDLISKGKKIPKDIMEDINDVIKTLMYRINELEQEEANLTTEISPDAQLLWVLSGGQVDAFTQYLQNFPSQATAALLGDRNTLQRTIQQLQQNLPQGQPAPEQDGVDPAPLKSSNIWGARYDPKSKLLRVRFQGGSVYDYQGIPEAIWKAFISGNASARTNGRNNYGRWWVGKNPSLGAALNQYIKAGGFPFRKIR